MKVEKFLHPKHQRMTFRVYRDGIPFKPINEFLAHIDKRDFAPNTLKAYSHDLVIFFRYLARCDKDWSSADIDTITTFVSHLKRHSREDLFIIPSSGHQARSLSTINRCLASLSGFYRYHLDIGSVRIIPDILSAQYAGRPAKMKELLSFAKDSRPSSIKRSLKPYRRQKPVKRIAKTLSTNQQCLLLEFCSNPRDRLLISLLIETGLRIGQALQLRHSDIRSWESKLTVYVRTDNPHEVYAKTSTPYDVILSDRWISQYTDFLIGESSEIDSDYVFTKLYRKDGGDKGEPLTGSAVKDFFRRFNKKHALKLSPHMLRHTYATELLRSGVQIEIVSKQLGHKSIETTKKIYEHLNAEDLKRALNNKEDQNG